MMGSRLLRIATVAVACVLVLAGCATGPDAETATTTSEAVPSPGPITAEVEADLTARALQSYCAAHCDDLDRFVYNTTLTATMPESAHHAMPASVREAIEAADDRFDFVTGAEADALFGPDGLVDGGRGILLSVGPVQSLTDRVVGIEVGGVTGRDGGLGIVMQFEWDGDCWTAVTPEQSGVTVTSWVA